MGDVYANVPQGLKDLNQWLLWRIEYDEDDKPSKVPYQANNPRAKASHSQPEHWASFSVATEAAELFNMGIGFVFTEADPYFGLDVDPLHKVQEEDRPAAKKLREHLWHSFQTYCEESPSGKGLHYIGQAKPPAVFKDSKYQIELYDRTRFFTITGRNVNTLPLNNCQPVVEELCATFAKAVSTKVTDYYEQDERSVDDIINAIRGWSNGKGFADLMDDDVTYTLGRYRNDHSAADMALINYIASATKDPEKAVAIFERSPLYRTTKGGYTTEDAYVNGYLLSKGFDRVWQENIRKAEAQNAAAEHGAAIAARMLAAPQKEIPTNKHDLTLPHVDLTDTSVCLPPGMAGEFVKSIHDATFTPNLHYALAVSFAYLSGVMGRGFRFGRNGCNTFMLVAGKSSTAKTQTITALEYLLNKITVGDLEQPPAARIISATAKTTQGIYDPFARTLAGAWITDECASMLKSLTQPVSNGDHELKDSINRLYDAAVPGKRWALSASRASNDKKSINCLSMGVAWFTTIEKMYESINEAEAKDGFLSRFVPVFYDGVLGKDNFNQLEQFPLHVEQTIRSLMAIVSRIDQQLLVHANGGDALVSVSIDPVAKAMLDEFNVEARNVARRAQDDKDSLPDVYVALSRVGMTAQRLAVTCAVMDNPNIPTIQPEHVQWAIQFVAGRTVDVIARMESGEIGQGDAIETKAIVSTFKTLLTTAQGGRIPSGKLHNTLRGRTPFKNISMSGGPMRAVKYALDNMVHDGLIERIVESEGRGRPLTYYMINDNEIWS